MTLQQFKCLNTSEQEFILRTKAEFIGSLLKEEGIYSLFQIDSFYLEVLCNGDETVVCSLSYFEEISLLAPYLELINIEFIYQLLGYGRMH